jgi:hypothetical protein
MTPPSTAAANSCSCASRGKIGPYLQGGTTEQGCVTGFIVDDEEDAIGAVRKLPRLDRRAIRARFEERFTAVRMAKQYEARYRELVADAEAGARILETAAAK